MFLCTFSGPHKLLDNEDDVPICSCSSQQEMNSSNSLPWSITVLGIMGGSFSDQNTTCSVTGKSLKRLFCHAWGAEAGTYNNQSQAICREINQRLCDRP